jgi:hypothetical protein
MNKKGEIFHMDTMKTVISNLGPHGSGQLHDPLASPAGKESSASVE